MRKLKIFEHISLDGVIQVGGSGEDGDYPYGDWTAPYRSPAGRDAVLAAHGESFDLLLGRRTYDLWLGFWPKAPGSPMSDGLNAATKYVATHRPDSPAWGPFESLGPDIVEDVPHAHSSSPARKLCPQVSLSMPTRPLGLCRTNHKEQLNAFHDDGDPGRL